MPLNLPRLVAGLVRTARRGKPRRYAAHPTDLETWYRTLNPVQLGGNQVDTLPHLVFADFLDEQGHPAHAEVVRENQRRAEVEQANEAVNGWPQRMPSETIQSYGFDPAWQSGFDTPDREVHPLGRVSAHAWSAGPNGRYGLTVGYTLSDGDRHRHVSHLLYGQADQVVDLLRRLQAEGVHVADTSTHRRLLRQHPPAEQMSRPRRQNPARSQQMSRTRYAAGEPPRKPIPRTEHMRAWEDAHRSGHIVTEAEAQAAANASYSKPGLPQVQAKHGIAEHLRGTRLAMHLLQLRREFARDPELHARLTAALLDRGLGPVSVEGQSAPLRNAEGNWKRIGELLKQAGHPWGTAYNWHRIGESLAVDNLVREFVQGAVKVRDPKKLYATTLKHFDPATGSAASHNTKPGEKTRMGGQMQAFWDALRQHVGSKLRGVYHASHYNDAALARSLRRQAYREQDAAEVAGRVPKVGPESVRPLVVPKPPVVKPKTSSAADYLGFLPGFGSAERYRRGKPVRYSHEAFHREMVARHKDTLPPLVYADWLDEQGQTAHAEVVRRHQQMAETGQTFPATHHYTFHGDGRHAVTARPVVEEWPATSSGEHVVSVGYSDPVTREHSYHAALLSPEDAFHLARRLESEGVYGGELARVRIARRYPDRVPRTIKNSRRRYARPSFGDHVRRILGLPTKQTKINRAFTHHLSNMTGGDALPAHQVETNREAHGKPGPVPLDTAESFLANNRHRDTLREALIASGHSEREASRSVTPAALEAWRHNGVAGMMDSESSAGRHGTARAIGVVAVRRLQEAGVLPYHVNEAVEDDPAPESRSQAGPSLATHYGPAPASSPPAPRRPRSARYAPLPGEPAPIPLTSPTARKRQDTNVFRSLLESLRAGPGTRAEKVAAALKQLEDTQGGGASGPPSARRLRAIAAAMRLSRRGRMNRYAAGDEPNDRHRQFQLSVLEGMRNWWRQHGEKTRDGELGISAKRIETEFGGNLQAMGDALSPLVYADYLDEIGHPAAHVIRLHHDPERQRVTMGTKMRGMFVGPANERQPPDNIGWTFGLSSPQSSPYPIWAHVSFGHYDQAEHPKYHRFYAPLTLSEASQLADAHEGFYGPNAYAAELRGHVDRLSKAKPRRYAAYRAPAGGMLAKGVFYPGGQTVPDVTKLAAGESPEMPKPTKPNVPLADRRTNKAIWLHALRQRVAAKLRSEPVGAMAGRRAAARSQAQAVAAETPQQRVVRLLTAHAGQSQRRGDTASAEAARRELAKPQLRPDEAAGVPTFDWTEGMRRQEELRQAEIQDGKDRDQANRDRANAAAFHTALNPTPPPVPKPKPATPPVDFIPRTKRPFGEGLANVINGILGRLPGQKKRRRR